MNSSLAASCCVAVTLLTPVVSAQTLCIRVYNPAHVPAAELKTALLETTRVFKPTGLRITWQSEVESPEDGGIDMSSPSARVADTRRYVVLTLLTGTPGAIYPGALGFALPFAHTGAHASIFYDRVEKIARAGSTPQYVVLGEAIAHELGHVLLRSSEHSRAGLMQTPWNRATWRLASEGLLTFLPEQLELIRDTALTIGKREGVIAVAAGLRQPFGEAAVPESTTGH
jgi:hypothetical protein